jgi:hypothetical protein
VKTPFDQHRSESQPRASCRKPASVSRRCHNSPRTHSPDVTTCPSVTPAARQRIVLGVRVDARRDRRVGMPQPLRDHRQRHPAQGAKRSRTNAGHRAAGSAEHPPSWPASTKSASACRACTVHRPHSRRRSLNPDGPLRGLTVPARSAPTPAAARRPARHQEAASGVTTAFSGRSPQRCPHRPEPGCVRCSASGRPDRCPTTGDEANRRVEVREVLNYVRAAELALRLVQTKPICLNIIAPLQATLVAGTRGDSWDKGRLRESNVYIGERSKGIEASRFVPPPPWRCAHPRYARLGEVDSR